MPLPRRRGNLPLSRNLWFDWLCRFEPGSGSSSSEREVKPTGHPSEAGSAVAFASAIVFATGITLVSLIYEDGANVHAVQLTRVLTLAAVMALTLAMARMSPLLPPRTALRCMLIGVLFCGEIYGLLSSVKYIPVGLAMLIMYTYPLMIAVAGWLTGTEPFTVDRLFAILAAFAGLALALHTPHSEIDWRGIAWAVFTAVTFSAVLIVSGRTMRGIDRRILMLYLTLTAAVIVGVVSLTLVSPVWPRTDQGWTLLAASTGLYVLATTLLFAAVKMIGPLRTAIIDNSAPVWAIVLAALLLGQRMSGMQIFGGVLVIGAVLLVQLSLRVPVRAASTSRHAAARIQAPGRIPARPPRTISKRQPRLTFGTD